MKTLKFNTHINAPREKVWKILWNDDTYRQWTAVFMPGSQATSDWQEGSSIQFTDGKGSGMYSVIETKQDNSKMVFKHLGEVSNGVEKPESDWAGSLERYTLTGDNGTTGLQVEVDVTADFEAYFNDKFPKAIEVIKQLAEQ